MKSKLLYDEVGGVNLIGAKLLDSRYIPKKGCVRTYKDFGDKLAGDYSMCVEVLKSCDKPKDNSGDKEKSLIRAQWPGYTFTKATVNDGLYFGNFMKRSGGMQRDTQFNIWRVPHPYGTGDGFVTSHVDGDGKINISHVDNFKSYTFDYIKFNEWYHMVFIWLNGGHVIVFINAELAATATSKLTNKDKIYLAKYGAYSDPLKDVDEVIIKSNDFTVSQLYGNKREAREQAQLLAIAEHGKYLGEPETPIEPPQEGDYEKGIAEGRRLQFADTKAAWDNFKDVSGIE